MKHRLFPQLDGMRGIAALMIVAHHYWPAQTFWDPTGGRIGVDFFFVLSGFLITRSLVLDHAESEESPWSQLRRFYFRRARRILPLFYVTCAVAAWEGWMTPSSGLYWHLSFLSNAYFIREGRFVGAAGHLWAVSVEQHFYLAWPLFILFLPRPYLRASALGLLALGVFSRAAAGLVGASKLTIDLLSSDACESLGAGALLAGAPGGVGLGLGLLGGALIGLRHGFDGTLAGDWLNLTATELSRSLILAALIAWGVRGIRGRIGGWLGSAPARALGRWSFAIYLSHNFVLSGTIANLAGRAPPTALPFIAAFLTLAWSAGAYHLIEKPLFENRRTVPLGREAPSAKPSIAFQP